MLKFVIHFTPISYLVQIYRNTCGTTRVVDVFLPHNIILCVAEFSWCTCFVCVTNSQSLIENMCFHGAHDSKTTSSKFIDNYPKTIL